MDTMLNRIFPANVKRKKSAIAFSSITVIPNPQLMPITGSGPRHWTENNRSNQDNLNATTAPTESSTISIPALSQRRQGYPPTDFVSVQERLANREATVVDTPVSQGPGPSDSTAEESSESATEESSEAVAGEPGSSQYPRLYHLI